ncbi:hypothetical protein HK097_007511 [Rhizophlyctis rosea]|uniref:YTH domain-containing protein n=1 Tax=Rhizophlyctis rosea TaxID=64517 RepID=A0AAD5SCY7_9FUNG|nr:hypothetical protein HK097_007511 [Rhizophlyctis rosea]
MHNRLLPSPAAPPSADFRPPPPPSRPQTWPSITYPVISPSRVTLLSDIPADISRKLDHWDAGMGSFIKVAIERLAMSKEEELAREKKRKVREIVAASGFNQTLTASRNMYVFFPTVDNTCTSLIASVIPQARYFVINSFTEDDVHKFPKYNIWFSTEIDNRRLNNALNSALTNAVTEMTTKMESQIWCDEEEGVCVRIGRKGYEPEQTDQTSFATPEEDSTGKGQ